MPDDQPLNDAQSTDSSQADLTSESSVGATQEPSSPPSEPSTETPPTSEGTGGQPVTPAEDVPAPTLPETPSFPETNPPTPETTPPTETPTPPASPPEQQ